ncbi:MAG: hypothetical protein O2983_06995 [Planctomycetota bacterium]|nr:hypothetical protein [Planctomycetota bacterium]MDA0919707.1 hypothetical protein [Planctomycetota bacterium]MDA1159340.1 hypothetical protein [Planctomycetota bacterium]
MNHRHHSTGRSIALSTLLIVAAWAGLSTTAVFGQVGFTDEQFEQWVFQQYGNAATARARLKESLELYTEDVDRSCGLSDAQKQKLRLAGRGDIERFFRTYEVVKKKFQAIRNDQQKVNQIFQDISPLQAQMMSGLFDSDSLLQKCLINTISRQQFLKYHKIDQERRRFHHESKVGLVVMMLDQSAPITAEQRQQLTTLLLRETRPPRKSGQYDYYVMMHQVSKIDAAKLKLILDDIQWQVFNQQLAQLRNIEQWLKQNGLLSDDDESVILLPDEQVAAE